jgi:hypothetical protein
MFDPDIIVEIFVFDEPLSKRPGEVPATGVSDPDPGGS